MNFDPCALCPKLCRHRCPVATATGREAATPTAIASVLASYARGQASESLAISAATLCIDCGACSDHCHNGVPLAVMLSRFRAEHLPLPAIEPLPSVNGDHKLTLVVVDERPVAVALSQVAQQPLSVLKTNDRLGVAAVEHRQFQAQGQQLKALLTGRDVVVYDGGVGRSLTRSGVAWRWLDEVAQLRAEWFEAEHDGAAGPLSHHHPEAAQQLARWQAGGAASLIVRDSMLKEHLLKAGIKVRDAVDLLINGEEGAR